jgi:hypothetical protein
MKKTFGIILLIIGMIAGCSRPSPEITISGMLSKGFGIETKVRYNSDVVTVDVVKYGDIKEIYRVARIITGSINVCIERGYLPKDGILVINFSDKDLSISTSFNKIQKLWQIIEMRDETSYNIFYLNMWEIIVR